MKKRFLQFTACLLVLVMAMAGFTCSPARAENKRVGTVTSTVGLRVRDAAGTVDTNHLGWLSYGAVVTILNETTVDGVIWYQVNGNTDVGNITGWSSGEYIAVREIILDGTFEEYLESQGFPESYREALTQLHALYPNWNFEAVHTGLDWNTAIAAESQPGVKLAYRTSPSHYIDWNDPYIEAGRDGYMWVQASQNIIAYYMDPRNFLSDPYIFMFESQSYNPQTQTLEGIEALIGHSFMKAENTFEVDGVTYTHAQAILEAATESGVSAYHLASRMLQEQGTDGSRLSLGTVPNYEDCYNYFNIGAYPHSNNDSEINGAVYAQSAGWTNPLLSIKGGAKILGSYYINDGQDTVYFQNFNVVSATSPFTHQYMTNVQAGETESQILRNAYTDQTVQMSLVFRIPIYENMPSSPVGQYGGRWHQDAIGWWYEYGNGGWPASQWEKIDGKWYYFNESGYMLTGWHYINNAWYWLDASGAMATGWLEQGDVTYYLQASGAMATGWQTIGGARYFFEDSGAMATGWQTIDNAKYYLNASGILQTGWLELEDIRYYLGNNGVMATGWQTIDGNRYFFYDTGAMATGWQSIDDMRYYLDDTGAMQTGWLLMEDTWYYLNTGGDMRTGWLLLGDTWYYLDSSGAMVTGWRFIDGTWYYFNGNGAMHTGWLLLGDTWYYLDSSGAMVTGWRFIDGTWYWFNEGGDMRTGWLLTGNIWYYFNGSGMMVTGRVTIDNTWHNFSSSGAWLG